MVDIPKIITERKSELERELNLAIIFNDSKRITYIQDQLNKLDEKIETRKEVENESRYL